MSNAPPRDFYIGVVAYGQAGSQCGGSPRVICIGFLHETFRLSVKEIAPQVLRDVKERADEDVIAILSIENGMRLEPEPPRADQQLVGGHAHFREVRKELKRAFKAGVVGFA